MNLAEQDRVSKASFYYLKDDDVIQDGDEWNVRNQSSWHMCDTSVGFNSFDYGNKQHFALDLEWKVRRLIKTTKLGNML